MLDRGALSRWSPSASLKAYSKTKKEQKVNHCYYKAGSLGKGRQNKKTEISFLHALELRWQNKIFGAKERETESARQRRAMRRLCSRVDSLRAA
jgi:hypothetical protein